MRYVLFILLLLSCSNRQKKFHIPAHRVSTTEEVRRKDSIIIDVHDPYQTGKDTVRLNKVMDHIFGLPEVQALDKRINKNTNGQHGVAIMVQDSFESDTSYYNFQVGDNSRDDRFENVFNFLLVKKSGEVKVYDAVTDSIMSLKEWQKLKDH